MASREGPTWRDRYPDEITCVRCLRVKEQADLDRMLWCDECRAKARGRAGWWGWLGGFLFMGACAIYVFAVIGPTDLVLGGWIATAVAAVWIGSKVSREIVYGFMRFRNTHAVEATPPDGADTAGEGPAG